MNKYDIQRTRGERVAVLRESVALEAILLALMPLSFDTRRRLLRWACERYGIDAGRLTL